MSEVIERLRPHLDDLNEGRTTVSALAKKFGVAQSTLSEQIARYFPDHVVGKGGNHPATTDTMRQAVAECEDPHVKIADVARKYGLKYLNLATRVKRRRDKLYAEAVQRQTADAQTAAQQMIPPVATPTLYTVSQEDVQFVRDMLMDADLGPKLVAIAKALNPPK